MSARTKLIIGTVAVAALAAGGAAFAAVELTSSTHSTSAPPVTAPFGDGIGSYGLGGGRLGGRGLGGGLGPGGGGNDFGGGGGFGFRRGFLGAGLPAAASYLGVSTSTLVADIRDGKTLAQVAKEQGKSVDGLVAAIVASQKKNIDNAVANGTISQAQAQQIESAFAARAKDLVNGARPSGGFRGGGFGGGLGGPGSGGSGGGTGSFGGSATA